VGWPPSAEQQARARDFLASLEQRFHNDANPTFFAWEAILVASNDGLPTPEWVLNYLYDAAGNLHRLATAPKPPGKRQIAPAIAEALGFVRGGIDVSRKRSLGVRHRKRPPGRFNPLSIFNNRDREIAAVVHLKLLEGSQLLYAYQLAAEQYGVKQRTAERAWKKYGRDYGKRSPR
jgi:hypothetical protein